MMTLIQVTFITGKIDNSLLRLFNEEINIEHSLPFPLLHDTWHQMPNCKLALLKNFSFRYKDGNDKMGFHKDDERELCSQTPIASLTLGAERDFIFKHQVPLMRPFNFDGLNI